MINGSTVQLNWQLPALGEGARTEGQAALPVSIAELKLKELRSVPALMGAAQNKTKTKKPLVTFSSWLMI